MRTDGILWPQQLTRRTPYLLKRNNEANNFAGPGPYGIGAARLWNVPVVATDALSDGKALVGDFSEAVLFDRLSLSVTLGHARHDQRSIHPQHGHRARRDTGGLRGDPALCAETDLGRKATAVEGQGGGSASPAGPYPGV
jgi:hypothetical protein